MFLGLRGYNTQTINQLIAAYGNGFVDVQTGLGFGIPLTSFNNVEFENFLGCLFFQNYNDTPLSYNGSVWSRQHCSKVPLSRYIKSHVDNRLYLGYIKILNNEYPSRVWYSDLPVNDTIKWGYELGTNLRTTAGSNLVRSANAGFKAYDLEIGDPFFIMSGNDIGEYRIKEIISDQQLRLNNFNGEETTLTTTDNSLSYWAGGNWFDVARDDGDYITWIESNFNQLLIFKRESLHRYNGSSVSQVKKAPGTTSGRSVISMGDWTIYFFGGGRNETGFYAYDSTDSYKISSAIQKYIDGISLSTPPIAWREGNLYRCFVGDISNTNENISLSNVVITYDMETKAWSIDPIADVVKVASEFRSGNSKNSYIGTEDGEIMQMATGSSFDGTPIPWRADLKAVYPEGTNWNNTFTKLRVISENGSGVKVAYRRRLMPFNSDDNFLPLGDLKNEMQEFIFPEEKNRASGIELRYYGISTTESVAKIKKDTIFYRKETSVLR